MIECVNLGTCLPIMVSLGRAALIIGQGAAATQWPWLHLSRPSLENRRYISSTWILSSTVYRLSYFDTSPQHPS